MKRTDLKEKSSVLFISKWIIFLGIITTASLSFILGFFVGKNNQPPVETRALVTLPQENAVQKHTGTEQKELVVQESHQQQEKQPQLVAQTGQETRKNNGVQQTVVNHETKESEKPPLSPENKNNQQIQKSDESKTTSTARKYAIQIGAFKNSADAKTLKAKFDKKGYKTFILTAKTKSHEKLYKVLVGEFSKREEAELQSVKIKKLEGMQTFVLLKPK